MIGGRSDQMVLLPFVSSGPARISWPRNYRPARHHRARAPPGAISIGSGASIQLRRDLEADKTLGQRLGPASPASNQAPSEATTGIGVKALIQSTSVDKRCKRPNGPFTCAISPVKHAALAPREGEAVP
jgi:hypothetical protein